ncbi:MAG: ABC transporter ATP-binding protein [Chloroflexota bacterium]
MSSVLRAIAYMRRYWALTLLAFLSLLAATTLSLFVPQILREVVDRGLPQPFARAILLPRFLDEGLQMTRPQPQLIFAAAGLLLTLSILRAIVAFGQRFFGERLSQYVSYDMRNDFYNKVMHLPFAYHDHSQMGQIITRAITDVDAVRTFIAQALFDGINVILLIIGVSIAMISLSARLSLIALLPVPLIMLTALYMGTLQVPRWKAIMEYMGGLSNLLEENVVGIQVVRSYNREEAEADRWADINQNLFKAQISFTETWSTYFPLMAFEIACCTALMLWQGAPLVARGELSIGTIVALNGYILLLALPVQRLGFFVQQFSGASTSARRVFEIMDEPVVIGSKPNAIVMPRIEGHVRFEDVSLHYGEHNPERLQHITFEAHPGQVIGLVGTTGGGKTSIVNMIPRFYDVTGGRVTIDGYDVRDVELRSLRSQIGIVLQETLLFTATVRENIAYGRPDATEDEIIAAATAADAQRFISEMPDGYDTLIGERGVTLSGGQRQRVAIARAICMRPRILILDDATSSVDTRTESNIQHALSELMHDCVTFIIAQRLTSVLHADLNLVIDHGQIAERGTHEELLKQGRLYYQMYRVQLEDQHKAQIALQATATTPNLRRDLKPSAGAGKAVL